MATVQFFSEPVWKPVVARQVFYVSYIDWNGLRRHGVSFIRQRMCFKRAYKHINVGRITSTIQLPVHSLASLLTVPVDSENHVSEKHVGNIY